MSENVRSEEEERVRKRKKRRAAAKRKAMKRRLTVLLISVIFIIILLILLAAFFSGVFYEEADESTLTILNNDHIVFEEITSLNEDYYDAKEMKEFVKASIDEYNKEKGSGSIKMKRFFTHGDKVYLRTEYKSAEVYSDFTGYTLKIGTVKSLKEDNVTFDEIYSSVKDGKKAEAVSSKDAIKDTGKKAVLIMENVSVKVNGSLDFVSDSCTEVLNNNTVRISQSEEDSDAVVTTYIIYE